MPYRRQCTRHPQSCAADVLSDGKKKKSKRVSDRIFLGPLQSKPMICEVLLCCVFENEEVGHRPQGLWHIPVWDIESRYEFGRRLTRSLKVLDFQSKSECEVFSHRLDISLAEDVTAREGELHVPV